jgi:hypothetical protein
MTTTRYASSDSSREQVAPPEAGQRTSQSGRRGRYGPKQRCPARGPFVSSDASGVAIVWAPLDDMIERFASTAKRSDWTSRQRATTERNSMPTASRSD